MRPSEPRSFAPRRWHVLLPWMAGVMVACRGGESTAPVDSTSTTTVAAAPAVVVTNQPLSGVVGAPLDYDAAMGGRTFSDPTGKGLTYQVSFSPSANGLTATGARVRGVPAAPGVVTVTVTATDGLGRTVSTRFPVVTFAAGLSTPTLPTTLAAYADARTVLPVHYASGVVAATDNAGANPITDAGATLGRVLFYDPRLSANDRRSCADCHHQSLAFGDTARLSVGFNGGLTGRHSMALANARYYARGRFFWDERAPTLEAQVVTPIQDATEMGMTLDALEVKLAATSYYPALFTAAFGTPVVTRDRVASALAQFVRSMVSAGSRYDQAFAGGGAPNLAVLTAQEQQGELLFRARRCDACHSTPAQVSDNVHNNGLDATITDVGAGGGRFKAPSLRNVGVRGRFMHDGRFSSLAEVVEFYSSGVQGSPNLDGRLTAPGGAPIRANFTSVEKDAMVAFLNALTDTAFLTDPRFASPFPVP